MPASRRRSSARKRSNPAARNVTNAASIIYYFHDYFDQAQVPTRIVNWFRSAFPKYMIRDWHGAIELHRGIPNHMKERIKKSSRFYWRRFPIKDKSTNFETDEIGIALTFKALEGLPSNIFYVHIPDAVNCFEHIIGLVVDFLNSEDAPTDLSRITFARAMEMSDEWHASLAKKKTLLERGRHVQEVFTITTNESPNSIYRVFKILTNSAARAIGQYMKGLCTGTGRHIVEERNLYWITEWVSNTPKELLKEFLDSPMTSTAASTPYFNNVAMIETLGATTDPETPESLTEIEGEGNRPLAKTTNKEHAYVVASFLNAIKADAISPSGVSSSARSHIVYVQNSKEHFAPLDLDFTAAVGGSVLIFLPLIKMAAVTRTMALDLNNIVHSFKASSFEEAYDVVRKSYEQGGWIR